MKHTLEELQEKQALPLELKISLTRTRVRAWIHEFGEDKVYVSFSGGKDSTVLLDLVRNEFGYKNVKAMRKAAISQGTPGAWSHPKLEEAKGSPVEPPKGAQPAIALISDL